MPGNIIQATPTEVMPSHLARAFRMELHYEFDLNQYGDGSSDRKPLTLNDRHYFALQQLLTPTDWQDLRTFYFNHQGRPFYFYNLRETVPPFTVDPTGQSPIGRYTVAFDGQWSETYGMQRAEMQPQGPGVPPLFKGYAADVSLGLREIV